MMNTRTRLKAGLMVAALVLPLSACDTDELLEVVDPDTVNPGTLEDPAALPVVIAGAVGDFQQSYSGAGGDAFLSSVAVTTDEFFSTGTFSTRTAMDRRNFQSPANGNTSDGAYTTLQRARRALLRATEAATEAGDSQAAELAALHAYTYIALAEGYCSHVPIADDTGEDPADGPPQTGVQLFNGALSILGAAGSTNLSAVARGRALLNLGQLADAAAAVAAVPTTWNYFIEHSSTTGAQNNPVFGLQGNGRYSISHREGGNQAGVPFRGPGTDGEDPAEADPRMPWFEDPAGGFDPAFRLFESLKYPDFSSNVVLASGIEARLIEAEAQLASGGDWLGTLNDLRADVGTLMAAQIDNYDAAVAGLNSTELEPLEDPGSDDARLDLLFEERAMWLWGTGHRMGDMRRLINVYGRSQADVFPSGAYHKGGEHGNNVAWFVDFDEVNNLLFSTDGTFPTACNPTSATWN